MIRYTGIGSQKAPYSVQNLFLKLGIIMAKHDLLLMSGHTSQLEVNFEVGCDKANGKKEIFLPWKGFNNSTSTFSTVISEAFILANYYCKEFQSLTQQQQLICARDVYKVLGYNLNTNTNFVVTWTPPDKNNPSTALVMNLATDYNIPIFNLADFADEKTFVKSLQIYIDELIRNI